MYKNLIDISPEVQETLNSNPKLLVALESTIICHGMPFPENVNTAKRVEEIVRQNGAIPATIAIINGRIKIGLIDHQFDFLASAENVAKVSSRDIAYALARKLTGATTVAATSLLASLVGIKIFVTGGIGGVHRDFQETMDVSNDLVEMGRTPVCVVSAGVKSILDIGKTLEYCETEGVLVMGYKTTEFPAFFTPKSGFNCYLGESDQLIAETIKMQFDVLNFQKGILVGVPVNFEDKEQSELIEAKTVQALTDAKNNGISGKLVTPFLLKRIAELTQANSLHLNIKLICNNAEAGAKIAAAYAKLEE